MSHVIALCGGVGGAKLALGLARALPEGDLTIVTNTGDDFEHLGLHVSPDLDTVAYTLSGLADRDRGWGMAGESWNFMASLQRLGGPTWFQLGDQDLAMHVERTRRLAAGETLTQVTAALTRALGVRQTVAPMSDDPVRTVVVTDASDLAFQEYFVRERCEPVARTLRFDGAERARPSPAFEAALARSDLACVIICPSNPYLSIDPILAIAGVRGRLAALQAPVVAVSPIVGGQALKGPAAKLMREFGAAPGVGAVADHYAGLARGLVIDHADASAAGELRRRGVETLVTDAVMRSAEDRERLASDTLALAARLRAGAKEPA